MSGDAFDVGRMDAPFAVDADGDGLGGVLLRIVSVELYRDTRAGDLPGCAGRLDDGQQREAHVGVLLLLDDASAARGRRVVDDTQVYLLNFGRYGENFAGLENGPRQLGKDEDLVASGPPATLGLDGSEYSNCHEHVVRILDLRQIDAVD